jgi:hypothetical protein
MADKLAKAEEQLAAPRSLCPRVCEERDDLAESIERYRSARK